MRLDADDARAVHEDTVRSRRSVRQGERLCRLVLAEIVDGKHGLVAALYDDDAACRLRAIPGNGQLDCRCVADGDGVLAVFVTFFDGYGGCIGSVVSGRLSGTTEAF